MRPTSRITELSVPTSLTQRSKVCTAIWSSLVVTLAAPMLIPAAEMVLVTLASRPGRSWERTRILIRQGAAAPGSHSTSILRAGSASKALGTGLQVDGDAATPRDEAHHLVARERAAALPEANQHVGLSVHADGTGHGLAAAEEAAAPGLGRLRRLLAPQPSQHVRGREPPVAHRREQIVHGCAMHGARGGTQLAALQQSGQRQPPLAQLALEDLAPQLAAALLLHRADRVADAISRPGGDHELQPVLARVLVRAVMHLDGIAILQLGGAAAPACR